MRVMFSLRDDDDWHAELVIGIFLFDDEGRCITPNRRSLGTF